jgi:hypothetical protein
LGVTDYMKAILYGHSLKQRLVRRLRIAGLPGSRGDLRLWAYKNRHRGRRAFIIGSGPSLKMEQLSRLGGEITFGMNQLYKCFNRTSWRPRYYALSDSLVAERYGYEILSAVRCPLFAAENLREYLARSAGVIYFRKKQETYEDKEPEFSSNPLAYVHGGYTTTYLCFQLAWFMGVREFYTLGIDANYALPATKTLSKDGCWERITNINSDSWFLPDYYESKAVMFKPLVKQQLLAHCASRRFIESHGGSVRNAGADSPLQVFDRVDFDCLF